MCIIMKRRTSNAIPYSKGLEALPLVVSTMSSMANALAAR